MDRALIQRWIAGQRAAERRSLELMAEEGPMSSEDSFAAAMELIDLADPVGDDPVREREVAEVRQIWIKLKKAWAAKHG